MDWLCWRREALPECEERRAVTLLLDVRDREMRKLRDEVMRHLLEAARGVIRQGEAGGRARDATFAELLAAVEAVERYS